MKVGSIQRAGHCLIPMVWRADNPLTRLRGLLGRRPLLDGAREALLLVPCNGVHTFGMGYSLDVVFLDANHHVLGWQADLHPWRAKSWMRAKQTLELATGALELLKPVRGETWTWLPQ